MLDIRIRAAEENDLSGILEIYRKAVLESTASFEIKPPVLDEMMARMREVHSTKLPYLVAEIEGIVAGYAYAVPYRSRLAYCYTVESSVYVAQWAQRQGVGRCLLKSLITACERADFRQMIAIIGGASHVASIRLHEKSGFRTVGVLENVGWKFCDWVDTVVMQRALGAGHTTPP